MEDVTLILGDVNRTSDTAGAIAQGHDLSMMAGHHGIEAKCIGSFEKARKLDRTVAFDAWVRGATSIVFGHIRCDHMAFEVVAEVEQTKEEDEVSADPIEEVAEVPDSVVQTPPAESEPEPEPEPAHSGLLMTKEGFAVRLPADSVNNIIKSLEKTPHDGFLPVVAFSPSGQIVLNFESKTQLRHLPKKTKALSRQYSTSTPSFYHISMIDNNSK